MHIGFGYPSPAVNALGNYRWNEEAKLVHRPVKACASFYIFGMFFNLILLVFVVAVAACNKKLDYYPGVPVTLAVLTGN